MPDTHTVSRQMAVKSHDDDAHLIFGWGMVSRTADGDYVVDDQGDWITEPELEKAAYDLVLNIAGTGLPVSGEDHDRDYAPDGFLVESVVFTEEKCAAMGVPVDAVVKGHWLGIHIPDADAYARVKSGKKAMLSIEGTAYRHDIDPPTEGD